MDDRAGQSQNRLRNGGTDVADDVIRELWRHEGGRTDHLLDLLEDPELRDHVMQALPELVAAYDQRLSRAAQSGELVVVGNCFPWHSRAAMQRLVAWAGDNQESVCMLGEPMPEYVYDAELIDAFKKAIESESNIRIIYWGSDEVGIPDGMRQLAIDYSSCGKFELWKIRDWAARQQVSHFMVAGNKNYRLERPHQDLGERAFTPFYPPIPATVCFNDPDVGANLCGIFDQAVKACGVKIAV